MVQALRVAVRRTCSIPGLRPTMTDVVQMLAEADPRAAAAKLAADSSQHPKLPADSMASPSPSPPASSPAREKPEEAASTQPPAGFIFMCSGATKPECFLYRVLGLPRGRLDAVSRIRRGAALFLYDFDAKYLYGPYSACSDGGLALEPAAFHGRFPAQVKFTIDGDFMPISESSLRGAIKENYSHGKFSPELTFDQVEKLRTLFRPIVTLPESAPTHYVDYRHTAPTASYLPPSASHPTQPAAYVHHPIAYVPSGAHLVQPEASARPYSHLPPPTAQFTTPVCHETTTQYIPQVGHHAYGPLPATYQHVQAPPSQYYVQSSPENVPSPLPVYTGPYYATHQNDPYQFDAVKSHYQESAFRRTIYGATHEMGVTNMEPVRHYGSIPSSVITAPEAATTNLQLVRSYGSDVNRPQQAGLRDLLIAVSSVCAQPAGPAPVYQ